MDEGCLLSYKRRRVRHNFRTGYGVIVVVYVIKDMLSRFGIWATVTPLSSLQMEICFSIQAAWSSS